MDIASAKRDLHNNDSGPRVKYTNSEFGEDGMLDPEIKATSQMDSKTMGEVPDAETIQTRAEQAAAEQDDQATRGMWDLEVVPSLAVGDPDAEEGLRNEILGEVADAQGKAKGIRGMIDQRRKILGQE
jgi:hypothetical protein